MRVRVAGADDHAIACPYYDRLDEEMEADR